MFKYSYEKTKKFGRKRVTGIVYQKIMSFFSPCTSTVHSDKLSNRTKFIIFALYFKYSEVMGTDELSVHGKKFFVCSCVSQVIYSNHWFVRRESIKT